LQKKTRIQKKCQKESKKRITPALHRGHDDSAMMGRLSAQGNKRSKSDLFEANPLISWHNEVIGATMAHRSPLQNL
jgi:hypothetical protein